MTSRPKELLQRLALFQVRHALEMLDLRKLGCHSLRLVALFLSRLVSFADVFIALVLFDPLWTSAEHLENGHLGDILETHNGEQPNLEDGFMLLTPCDLKDMLFVLLFKYILGPALEWPVPHGSSHESEFLAFFLVLLSLPVHQSALF